MTTIYSSVSLLLQQQQQQISIMKTQVPSFLLVLFLVFVHHHQLDARSLVTQLQKSRPETRKLEHLPVGLNAVGPESVAFDCEGHGPYVGVSDGRILKWQDALIGWTQFAITNPKRSRRCDGVNDSPQEQNCGRPLGLKFNYATCELYIADSSFGLLKVDRNGGAAVSLATAANGIPFRFVNDLDIDILTGLVYFTDTSSRYNRWEYELAITTRDRTGRLMQYDPKTRAVTVLLRDLYFANGVALSKNKDFVLVAETTTYQITRFWLRGPKARTSEVFLHLTGRPDNINRNANGDFWIAQNPTKPIKVDEFGRKLEVLDTNEIKDASDVVEFGDQLWVGSVVQNYLLYTITK